MEIEDVWVKHYCQNEEGGEEEEERGGGGGDDDDKFLFSQGFLINVLRSVWNSISLVG